MFRFVFILLLFSNALLGQCTSQRYIDPIFAVNTTSNVLFANADPYGLINNQNLYLDIYQPINDNLSKRPVIVHLFGGAFAVGDKAIFPAPDLGAYWASRGYVFVSIQYRLGLGVDSGGPERAVYRAVQDLRAALRFLKDNSTTYGLDMDNIITGGCSAGSIASLHSAYMEESERPNSSFGTFWEPSDLGCVDCSGNNANGNTRVLTKGLYNYWGAIGDTLWITQAPQGNIPALHIHADNDALVPYDVGHPFTVAQAWPLLYGSLSIHNRLSHLGMTTELHTLYGAGHEPEILNNASYLDTLTLYSKPFFYNIIKPQTPNITGNTTPYTTVTETYSVAAGAGSTLCWNVSAGGTIVSQSGSTVSIQWNQAGVQTVRVVEKNSIDAVGNEVVLTVNVAPNMGQELPSELAEKIVISPNPFDNQLAVSIPSESGETNIKIFDLTGQVLVEEQFQNTTYIDLSRLSAGMYFVELKNKFFDKVKKIQKSDLN